MFKKLALLVLILMTAASCSLNRNESSTSTTKARKIIQGEVEFEKCGVFECASISVPMDYDNPKGRKIDIALTKRPADDQKNRIGVLLVNPGGPGASGIDFVRQNASFLFGDEVLEKFDIIGWDPRGVGQSTKPNCAESLDKLFKGIDYSPDDDAELKELFQANAWLGKQCAKADEDLLPHLSTLDSVDDIESIREALREEKINYLGFSYGTSLGQIYATKYPDNFRTMVIDGVVDLELDPEKTAIEQIVGFEDSLNEFFEYCRNKTCTYARGKDPKTAYVEIVNSIDANPVVSPLDSANEVGPSQMDVGVPYYLYGGVSGWRSLDLALDDLQDGDPQGILNGFNSYLGRRSDGSYDGSYESFLAIGCADGSLGDQDKIQELSLEAERQAPILGRASMFLGLPCSTWPNVKEVEDFEVENTGSSTIVVIGTTGDPATPVQWARSAAQSLGNSVYIERVGEGHTAYGQGNVCIDDLVNNYFVSGEKPNSKVC